MRILTRYLLRAHIGPFFFALAALTGLLMVNTVAQQFEEIAGKGLPPEVMVEFFVLSIPPVIALTLPMAVLTAVLYTFSRLAADNEITALKASGVNLARLLVPLLIAATLLAGGMVWFHDQVLPDTNHRLANLMTDIARKSPTFTLEEQILNEIRAGQSGAHYYLRAARIDASTNRLWDVTIYDMSRTTRHRTIYADSGRMAFNRAHTDLYLTLYDGTIYELSATEPETFQRLRFDRQRIRIAGVADRLKRSSRGYRSDRELSLGMLQDRIEERRMKLREVRGEARTTALAAVRRALGRPPPDSVRPDTTASAAPAAAAAEPGVLAGTFYDGRTDEAIASSLGTLSGRIESILRQIRTYQVEYHKKFSISFACIVFVLIGAPLAIRFPRGGVGMVITVSLAIFTVYYMGLIGGEELADEGIVSPFWAMWAPNAIFLALGLWGLARIGHESSTARGGGWGDLWRSLKGLAMRPVRALTGGKSR